MNLNSVDVYAKPPGKWIYHGSLSSLTLPKTNMFPPEILDAWNTIPFLLGFR